MFGFFVHQSREIEMRRYLAIVGAVLGLAFVGGSPAGAVSQSPAVIAKTCSAGYVHAVIGGQQKCLRRGEFCAHGYARQYQRYGFSCTKIDNRGNYHLT
jgi:hypothetical protein